MQDAKRLDDPELYRYVKERFLEAQWSLEQISGRIKLEGSQYKISYNTISRAIYAGQSDEKNLSHGNRGSVRKLRHRGKSRHTKDCEERAERYRSAIRSQKGRKKQRAIQAGRLGS